jgi:hypothetical protein
MQAARKNARYSPSPQNKEYRAGTSNRAAITKASRPQTNKTGRKSLNTQQISQRTGNNAIVRPEAVKIRDSKTRVAVKIP